MLYLKPHKKFDLLNRRIWEMNCTETKKGRH